VFVHSACTRRPPPSTGAIRTDPVPVPPQLLSSTVHPSTSGRPSRSGQGPLDLSCAKRLTPRGMAVRALSGRWAWA
jgi:hypothetical protein